MRVALVIERFDSTGGGVEHAAWQVAHALAEGGDEVHVVARTGIESNPVRLHRVRVPSFWQPLRVAAFSRRARHLLGDHRFDVVHTFSRTLQQDIFHTGGGSHAQYMHCTYGRRGASLRRLSPRHALQLEIERRVFSDSSQLIQCVSKLVKKEIAERYPSARPRLSVIPYGVDAGRFDAERHARSGLELRRQLGAGDATVWLLAGSGWRRKGLDTAFRALALAADRRSELWVAGRDSIRPWRRLADRLGVGERVHFLGPRDDLERVYAAADGLLLPTRYDAFGMV